MKRLLLIGLLMLTACSSSPAASSPSLQSPVPAAAPATPLLVPSSRSTGQPAGEPLPQPSIAPGSAITGVLVATSLRPDGSAQAPAVTFDHNRDRKLIAILDLSGVSPGTKLSYVRYLDGKYVDSKSAATLGNARHFYFEFTAPPGQTLTPGVYRLRLYVSEHAVGEVTYRVL